MNQQFTQDLAKLSDFIIDSNEVGIVIGNHQTLDTVASALAFYLALKNAGKSAQIVSVKEPLVEVSSLVGVDQIRKSFSGNTTKLVVALPYIKGEVEKVLFTEQADTINFHLTAAQGRTITPFDLSQVKLKWEGGAPKNIITVGVGSQNEIMDLIDVDNSRIVNIDNYQNNSKFGEIVLVDESFSSLSEIIGKIIKDEKLPFDQDVAQNILDGVLFATRNFTKGNTSPAAFEAASNAMYQGAQRRGEELRPPMSQNEARTTANQPQMGQNSFDNSPFGASQGKQAKQSKPFDPYQGKQQFGQGGQRPFDVAQRQAQNQPSDYDLYNNPSFDASSLNNAQGRQGQGRQSRQNQNEGNQRRDNRNSRQPYDSLQNRPDNSMGRPGKPTQQGQNRNQRVNQNDFPAMHIQDIRNQIQNDARMQNQRNNNSQKFNQPSFDDSQSKQNDRNQGRSYEDQQNKSFDQASYGNAPFPQSQQKQQKQTVSPMPEDIYDPRDQAMDDQMMPQNSQPAPFDSNQDRQTDFNPKQGMQAPAMTESEPQNYENINDEDVPDDWLMPKVFKSSKNNN